MNIGFDAKRAFKNKTGLGNYSRTLIDSLIKFYPENNYFLFTPEKTNLYFPSSNQAKIISPSNVAGKLFKSAWRSSLIKFDLQKNNIDVFHGLSHEIPFGLSKHGIKTVVTIHDLIHEKFPEYYRAVDRKIYTKKFKYACQNANKIIAISQQTKNDIIDLYKIEPNKIEVIYQSVNPVFINKLSEEEKKNTRLKFNLPESFLLYVGSIIERKNLLNLIKAIAILPIEYSLPLVIIGDGREYKTEVQKKINELNLKSRVIFLSSQQTPINNEDLPGIYQNCKALIYPSFYEGFGLPVVEGIMSNIPVITSNVSCLPEAGGNVAFYCNPNQPESIAEQIQVILSDSKLVQQKTASGEKHLEKFSPENISQQLVNIYQSI